MSSPRPRFVLDLRAIKTALVADPVVKARIRRDFGLQSVADEHLIDSVLLSLGQTPIEDPLSAEYSPHRVFEAAVRAIGSNSRSWASFTRRLEELKEQLDEFDPSRVKEKVKWQDLVPFFPGQTGSGDAKGVVRWAKRLSDSDRDFRGELRQVAGALKGTSAFAHDSEVLPVLMPTLAAYFGNPPARGPLAAKNRDRSPAELKWPRMGAVLGSEFLRNLGWSGFKADRHVVRLLGCWVGPLVEHWRPRAGELARQVGRQDKETIKMLAYSLTGMDITPPDCSYSHADNLVWLLGAYVERKGCGSGRVYVRVVHEDEFMPEDVPPSPEEPT